MRNDSFGFDSLHLITAIHRGSENHNLTRMSGGSTITQTTLEQAKAFMLG